MSVLATTPPATPTTSPTATLLAATPSGQPVTAAASLAAHAGSLRDVVRGPVLVPGEPGYTELAPPFNLAGAFDPLAVVDVVDAADVAAVMRYAATVGAEVAVRATGHGATPYDARPATILVRTHLLNQLEIRGRTARVGAGVSWGQLLAAAAPHGWAAPAGSAPGVSVVGYVTGGGLSPVGRSLGYASDHVVALDVVTGDGVARRATATENPALFWGLRGGKGSLGIVTAAEIALVELPTIVGGCAYLEASREDDLLAAWAEWSTSLPTQASTSIAIMRLPVMPGIPEPLAGRTSIAVRFAWTGDHPTGQALIGQLIGSRPVLLGGYGPMPFRQLGTIHNDPVDPMPVTSTGVMLDQLPPAAVEALDAVVGEGADCPQLMVELRLLGGALNGSSAAPSAVCRREAAFLLHTVGLAVPPLVDAVAGHCALLRDTMAPWTSDSPLLPNFGTWTSPPAVARQYDRQTLGRLATLASTYDPAGVIADGNLVRAACAHLEER